MLAAHVRTVVYIIDASLIRLDPGWLVTLTAEGEGFVAKQAATHDQIHAYNSCKFRIGHYMNVYEIMEASYK